MDVTFSCFGIKMELKNNRFPKITTQNGVMNIQNRHYRQ